MILKKEAVKFLNYIKSTKSKETYKTYESVLKEALDKVEIEGNVIDITPYRLKIAHQSKKTIAKKVSVLRSFFNFLKEGGFNFKIRGDEHIKVPKTLPKPINITYIKKALQNATMEEYLAVLVLFSLGVRISEAVNIKLGDIKGEWIEIRGKGAKSRLIPLHPKLREFIKSYLTQHPRREYLFEKNAKPLTPNQLRYLIQKAFKRVGIHATPHQLRHSFATLMLDKGARINDVSELLGHKFIATTQIYTKLSHSLKLRNYQKAHPLCR